VRPLPMPEVNVEEVAEVGADVRDGMSLLRALAGVADTAVADGTAVCCSGCGCGGTIIDGGTGTGRGALAVGGAAAAG